MAFASCFFDHQMVFFNVVQAFADLDQPNVFEALDAGPINCGCAALSVVALAVPTIEGEGDLLLGFGEEGFKILADNRGVVVLREEVVSQFVGVFHFVVPPFVVFPFGSVLITLNGDNSKTILKKTAAYYVQMIFAVIGHNMTRDTALLAASQLIL